MTRWTGSYDAAERRAVADGKGIFIYYRDRPEMRRDPFAAMLFDDSICERLSGYVPCLLYRSQEPNRRYLAQYGVERAPAVVLIHPDGTYHARSGPLSADQAQRFFAEAEPPGTSPILNPHIPRPPRYVWHKRLPEALAVANHDGRGVLVIYHRWGTADWRRLSSLLDQPDVARRLAGMVHCRIHTLSPWARAYITPFGAVRLPAAILVAPGGEFSVLESPLTANSFVHFIDESSRAVERAPQSLPSPLAGS